MGVRRGIDRKKVGCRSLIDANLECQVGVNKIKLYRLSYFVSSEFHDFPLFAHFQYKDLLGLYIKIKCTKSFHSIQIDSFNVYFYNAL